MGPAKSLAMKLPCKGRMRQGLQVAGEPMKHISWPLAAMALAVLIAGCGRFGHPAPPAAVEACGAPRALLAIRRAELRLAAEQGASADLLGRLRRESHASLDDPEVKDYDRHTATVTCTALLRLQPPGQAAQEISSTVTYEAQPLRDGVWRYRLTDPGQVVQAIASLGPLPPESAQPPASSAAANALAEVAESSAEHDQTLQDAAAAGDTGHVRRPAPSTPAPPPR